MLDKNNYLALRKLVDINVKFSVYFQRFSTGKLVLLDLNSGKYIEFLEEKHAVDVTLAEEDAITVLCKDGSVSSHFLSCIQTKYYLDPFMPDKASSFTTSSQ